MLAVGAFTVVPVRFRLLLTSVMLGRFLFKYLYYCVSSRTPIRA